jgi:hypothetical protein
MGLFGKPKQLKHLDNKLTAARMSFGMFARLPEQNKQHFLNSGPREVSQAVAAAVRAGHAAPAKKMLDQAASQTPSGATEEQWRTFLAGGFNELDRS